MNESKHALNELFRRVAHRISNAVGTAWAFMIAGAVIVAWAASGPIFDFSDTWQLVINTGTTVVTFLMVFLIQNAQNRESRATQLKLDELIRAVRTAHNEMIDIEELSDEELETLHARFRELRRTPDDPAYSPGARRDEGDSAPDEDEPAEPA